VPSNHAPAGARSSSSRSATAGGCRRSRARSAACRARPLGAPRRPATPPPGRCRGDRSAGRCRTRTRPTPQGPGTSPVGRASQTGVYAARRTSFHHACSRCVQLN
jgi:hypothetical protein